MVTAVDKFAKFVVQTTHYSTFDHLDAIVLISFDHLLWYVKVMFWLCFTSA